MLEVYAYNAGKGDCIRIRFADTHNIIIDSGVMRFAPDFKRLCDRILASGETLDALILTHVDDDHIGGILSNLRHRAYRCPFQEVWMNWDGGEHAVGDTLLSTRQNNEVHDRLVERNVPVIPMTRGNQLQFHGAQIYTVWPESGQSGEQPLNSRSRDTLLARHSDYHRSLSELAELPLPPKDTSCNNKQSIVFTFSYENRKLLFTGDAWAEDVVKADGEFDLIKLPHHGSARNISEAYCRGIKSSRFLICTDGIAHPDKQTIAKLEKWYGNITVYIPVAWWKKGYFVGDDRNHRITYEQTNEEGLVIAW